jgi:hypothetical protein
MPRTRPTKTHDFWVTLRPDVATKWSDIYPDGQVPVKSPQLTLCDLPGFRTPQRCYLVAIDQLTNTQLLRIAYILAQTFGLTQVEALQDIRAHGIPVRAEHVSYTAVHNHLKWMID